MQLQTLRYCNLLAVLFVAVLLTACGGDDVGIDTPPPIGPQSVEKTTGSVAIPQGDGYATPDNPAKASYGKPATITIAHFPPRVSVLRVRRESEASAGNSGTGMLAACAWGS